MAGPLNPILLACGAVLLLSGCAGGGEVVATEREDDPALAAALGGPILVDPDLVGQNRANSVAAMPWQSGALPTVDANPEAVAAARAEALRLVGGPGRMQKAPEASGEPGGGPSAVAGGANADCAGRAEYTTRWAARLPAPFPVYPRGAVQEAAGTDAGGCALRVVNFVTPVPVGEMMDFYYTRARDSGFSAERGVQDGDDVLAGVKGGASYMIHARRLPSGNTEVDLVTSGGSDG